MSGKGEETLIQVLEFDTLLSKLSGYTVSPEGKASIEALFPFTDRESLVDELSALTELKDILEYDEPFPLTSFVDIRPLLKRAEVRGAFLRSREFLALDEFLKVCRRVKAYLSEREEKVEQLAGLARPLAPKPDLERAIGRVVEPSGEVKDSASENLSRIRRAIVRMTGRVRKRLDAVLNEMVGRGFAQEDGLVLRDGRLVIPMKEGHRGRLKGVIVDQSSSGATVFMEPLEVLETNNEIRQLMNQEKQEIERILIGLTETIQPHLDEMETNLRIAGRFDALMARARLSIELNGMAAEVSEDDSLILKNGIHPLLLLRKQRAEVVPLSLNLGEGRHTLIITGPNAGGKTVALKTVGLLSMMHRYGLHVPAGPGTSIPLYDAIFADIGDFQSIEQDLSTFSSHIENIKTIQKEAGQESLVLIDEIGAATDPTEGAALAEVIIRDLTQRGCSSIVTTHMGTLKAFAHEEAGVENGSLAFDGETLCPTYRFQMGIPGSSYAFEIADRLGLPRNLIDEARDLVGEERGRLDRLVLHLEQQLAETQGHLRAAEKEESRLEGLVKLYGELSERLQKEGDERKQEILQEVEDLLKDANATVERVVKEIRENNAGKESIREARKAIETRRKKVKELSRKRVAVKPATEVKQGDWVSWKKHPKRGEVVSDPDGSGRVFVQLDGLKLRIPVSELEQVSPPKTAKKSSGSTHYAGRETVRDEVDLRGMTAEEAVEVLERYLGEARTAGYTHIRIIHGKGTGVLRNVVGHHLKGHALVKTQRLGNWNEGDTGVTIAELR